MRLALKVALALCVAAPSAVAQPPTTGIESVPEFRPFLSANAEPAMCQRFLKTWTALFDAVAVLQEHKADMAATFPDARVTRLDDFYNTPRKAVLDVDADGVKEVLYFNPTDIGWRYGGPELHLFETEGELATALDVLGPERPWGIDFERRAAELERPVQRRLLHDYGPAQSVDLIEHKGRVYATGDVDVPNEDKPSQAALYRIVDGAFATTCVVDLLPAKQTFAGFRDTSALFASLADMYGQPVYQGTMGWTAEPADEHLLTVLYRPWAMPAVGYHPFDAPMDPAREDAARELRFLNWGAGDPQSWRDYLEVKQARTAFIADMRHHYSLKFAKPGRQATALAEEAWRYLLDQVVYARNPDQYQLAGIGYAAQPALQIRPDSSPEQIVRTGVEALKQISNPDAQSLENWDRLLMAAINLRLPEPYVRELAERAHPNHAESTDPREKEYLAERRAMMLLAALGHNGLSELAIEFGADPNARTGDINKTPLMYAAQHDRLNAIRFLLARNVYVNAQTGNETYGYQLRRDHRTALMYAAENASGPVIDALLAARADVMLKDTMGNTAAWYFSRNTKITDSGERARILRRLGG